MEKASGQRIGRYQIVEKIGHGPMGSVYKAFDPMIKRHLAIKTIALDSAPDSEAYRSFLERFYDEARTAGNLTHPNIITIYDVGEEGGIPYLAFEHIEGELLSKLIQQKATFSREGAILVIGQVAAALDYAHSKSALHRNLNPDNILIYHHNRVKVMDFGITTLGEADSTMGSSGLRWSKYVAPERALGRDVGRLSDNYSLAAIAFGLFTGQQPFQPEQAALFLGGGGAAAEADLVSAIGSQGFRVDAWRESFVTALDSDPQRRFATAGELVQSIWDAQKGVPESLESFMQSGLESGRLAFVRPQDGTPTIPARPARVAVSTPRPAVMPTVEHEMVPTMVLPPRPAPPLHSAQEDSSAGVGAIPEGTTVLPPRRAAPPPPPPPRPAPPPQQPPLQPPPPSPQKIPVQPPPVAPAAITAKKPMAGTRTFMILTVVLLIVGLLAGGYYLLTRPSPQPRVVQPEPQPGPKSTVPPQTQPRPTAATGSFELHTTPEGATVYINGEAAGQTPVTRSGLSAGTYSLRFEMKGYEPVEEVRQMLVDPNGPQVVQVALQQVPPMETLATLKVYSTPPGATILLDGRNLGKTPKSLTKLRPGQHVLELSLDGYIKWASQVTARAGKSGEVNAALQTAHPEPVKQAAPPPEPPPETGPFALSPAIKFDRKPISGEQPALPKSAARLSGSVLVKIVVSENGSVERIDINESGGSELDHIVMDCVRKWKFKPAIRDGRPVSIYFLYRFTFRSS